MVAEVDQDEDDALAKSLEADQTLSQPQPVSPRSGSSGSMTTSRPASASTSRNASGNLRYEQFEQLLRLDVVDLEQLRKLSWGGIPTEHRPTAWRLLLVCLPIG